MTITRRFELRGESIQPHELIVALERFRGSVPFGFVVNSVRRNGNTLVADFELGNAEECFLDRLPVSWFLNREIRSDQFHEEAC